VRTYNLMKYLIQRHEITLITQRSEDVTEAQINTLQEQVQELVVFSRPTETQTGKISKLRRLYQFWQGGTPPNVMSLYSPAMQEWVDKAVAEKQFDAITCEHSVNEIYVLPQWRHQLQTIINIHSSVYRTCENQLATKTSENPWRDRLYLPLLKRYERQLCQKFSQIVVTTEEDKQQLQQFNPPSEIAVIPNGVDLDIFFYRTVDPGGYNIIITGGMDYLANIDAACFFSLEIFPLLQKKYPQATLKIVGSKPSPRIIALGKLPGITVTGRVPSMVDYLHQATVCVVPMRSGFGIKNKTLEAMAAGIPIVASDRGLEGLEVDSPGIPLRALRANYLDEYITEISRLFEDAGLRDRLSQNGRKLIEQEYTWERLAKKYEQIILN
jgi:glycosyltransferase involved in cell wall biosynthesis